MKLQTLQPIFDDLLQVSRFAGIDDQNGIFLASNRTVLRLGLALEPFPDLTNWLATERADALFIHRPWKLTDAQREVLLREEIGVLAYHLAFDESLTTGLNPALAERCGWGPPKAFGAKDGRPLGMICTLPGTLPFSAFAARLDQEFAGLESSHPPAHDRPIEKVAVVGAMTDALARAAHEAGVQVYVTGQFRQPARRAVEDTGLGVLVLGHHRSEVWGLRTLADRLQTHLPITKIVLAGDL